MTQKYKFTYEYISYQKHFGDRLTVEQTAMVLGVKPETVRNLIEHEIIEAEKTDQCIHVRNIPKLKKIIRLHYDLGIGWNSLEVVSDLLDRIEELEAQLGK